ncbi:MAG: histidine kinase, partial [Bacteroidales bacterium]|nr:histidine kinase [Bacteroidales bacterium]
CPPCRIPETQYFLVSTTYTPHPAMWVKTEQDKTTLQQKLLSSQMNPHFLFNSLASIQNFIIKEKPAVASDYLGRFSKLVRQILNNSVEEWITLEDEVGSIENYLALQKVRYRDMFDYTIEMDKWIDPETTLIPPMLTQPFIENSIEHGFKNKEEKGKLQIRFELNGSLIRFEVEDDGVGREKARKIQQEQNKDHQSMGTDITNERLMVLNKKLKQKISLIISDLKNEQNEPAGTKVVFDIPYKYS